MRCRSFLITSSSVLALAFSAWGQTQPSNTQQPAAPKPGATTQRPAPLPAPLPPGQAQQRTAQDLAAADPEKVPPTATVIDLKGLCDAGAPKTADCDTTVTKEQFEKLAAALDPTLRPEARPQVATQYSQILVMANEAQRHGVADSPRYQEILRFLHLQILANLYNQQLQEESKTSTPEASQKYYNEHQNDFQEVTLLRIVIPRNVPPDAKKLSEPELAALATSLDDRAKKGEEFEALQKAAWDAMNMKGTPPPTSLGPQRRSAFAAVHAAAVKGLKPGEVSTPVNDSPGYFIYKLVSERQLPLEQVQTDVQRALQTENYQEKLAAVFASVKASVNPQYFGAFASVTLPGQQPAQPQAPPRPSLATPPATAPKPPSQ